MYKAHIMVVEDENVVALDIASRLTSLGYMVSGIASSGEQAIRQAARTRPDLVLMDIKLKGKLDGIEAAERIRTRFDIPVIYLTAYADGTTLQRAKITEPFGYLLKPLEERELHITIEIALYKHKMEQRLKESERWLATTLRSIGDGVIATDAQGCVKFMNPVAEALTGWKQEEALGKNSRDVFHIINRETKSPSESPVREVLQDGFVVGLGIHSLLVAKDGTEIPIDDSAAPIRDDNGHVSGVVLVFRDITERVQAEEALHQHAAELQVRNEELVTFAHTVAHGLENPLGVMVGFAEALEEDYATMPEEDAHSYLQTIARNGRKMSNIIDELLLLAQVRQAAVKMRPLDMASIVAEAQGRLADMIEKYYAEIILPPPGAWPVALGHGPWVEEVWANYMSNAIKYGGRPPRVELGFAIADLGSPVLDSRSSILDSFSPQEIQSKIVRLRPTADGRAHDEVQNRSTERSRRSPKSEIVYWVRDNGHGLTPEEQARLFTPFERLGQVRVTGHGLGLSIVRHIVEKLDGQVGVESQVSHGSVFTFTLPATTARSTGE